MRSREKEIKENKGKKHSGFKIFIYFVLTLLIVVRYGMAVSKIIALKTPMQIAKYFMDPRYDYEWVCIPEIDVAEQSNGFHDGYFEYKIELREKERHTHYSIQESYLISAVYGNTDVIHCETRIEKKRVTIASNYFDRADQINFISVAVSVYNEEEGWEKENYFLKYMEGKYVLDPIYYADSAMDIDEVEERTQMSIEEIVETAQRDQERLEKILYKMKIWELIVETIWLIVGILLLYKVVPILFQKKGSNKGSNLVDKSK